MPRLPGKVRDNMKKFIAVLLAAVITAFCAAGCGAEKTGEGKLKIIAAIYPEYEWVKNIVGDADGVELSLLLDSGVDIHSYQPTAKDIVDISSCDVFIYNGGESDAWADDVIKEANNKELTGINLLEALGSAAKKEEAVEGMQTVEESGEEGELDEHIWLSLRNAALLSQSICDKLCEKDAAHKDIYKKNTAEYISKLNTLDKKYSKCVREAKNDTLIFADRFPFRYMTEDYNLKYYAAFSGCSAESEASFQTLVFLADKLNGLNLDKLMIIDGSDKKIAEAVADTAKRPNLKILTLNSMQSAIGEDENYLSIMEKNLTVLNDALN